MNKITLFAALFLIPFFGMLNSCNNDSTTPTPAEFVADNNTFKDFTSWTVVAQNQGPDPALGPAHSGNDNSVTRTVYIKNNQERIGGFFPVGTLVVKHTKNPSGTVNEFTAMVKRGNKFNPDGNDWEWFMLKPDGTIATDDKGNPMRGANLMDGMCTGCHSGAKTKDFVFSK